MRTTQTKTEGISSARTSDFLYEAIRGTGMVGGYIHNVVTDTIYYAGKYAAYVRDLCSGLKVPLRERRGKEAGITIVNMMRNDSAIGEADRREFYMNFGRDMVDVTKAGLENENLTIIELSKYKM